MIDFRTRGRPRPIVTSELGVVLIGPPGVGKGTQAARLQAEFNLAHIATGDLLREHRARGTDLGRDAAACMAQGQLVPDALVVAMVRERIQQAQQFLLDGFPRTVEQARALSDLLNAEGRRLNAAVLLEAPDDIVVERIACRGEGRDDDRPATVRRRLQVFHRSTAPIVEYYEQLGILHRIDAARPVHDVAADARSVLGALPLTACAPSEPRAERCFVRRANVVEAVRSEPGANEGP